MLGVEKLPERVLEAQVVIRHEGCAVSEGLTDGAQCAQVSADRNGDVLVMQAPDERLVDAFVKNVQDTQAEPPTIISRTPTSVIMRGKNPEWGVVSTIYKSGCNVLWPAIWRDGLERYTVVAPTRERLDALLRDLSRLGETRVERISEITPPQLSVSVPIADLTGGLTARQLQALQLAITNGYYATPRRTSTVAMATHVGVSRSTFEEHLRKAEQRVLDRISTAIAASPALQAGAIVRPGRQPASTRVPS